jgi:hypothetical protein
MYILDFLQILQKLTSIYWTTSSISKTRGILLRFKMTAVEKWPLRIRFLTITLSISNMFTFSFLLFVSHHITQISQKKSFLSCTKWRRILKMVAKFQWAVTFFLMIFFFQSGFCIVFVLKMEKIMEEIFEFFTRWRHSPKELVRIGFSTITS